MRITVISVGKLKEGYWRQAVGEYAKRLGAYTRLELIEVEDEKTPEQAGIALENQIRQKEGERLLARCPKDGYVIAMAIDGASYDSPGLARHLERLTVQGYSHLVFIIGGSLGLSEAVFRRANERISFSALTFPHQLMRVILLEQIYRSFRIQKNEPYHK